GKRGEARGLFRGQRTAAATDPNPIAYRGVSADVVEREHHHDAGLVEWSGFDQSKPSVGTHKDDARMMNSVGPGDQVPPPEPESLVGRQEDVAGLGRVGHCRSPQLPVSAVRWLADERPV